MKNRLVCRYAIFLVGLFLNAFGVAFITKASLGTTPIASIPYTLSLIFPQFTLGNFTIAYNVILIALQVAILRKKAKPIDIVLQIPITVLFGYVIDFSMWLLVGFQPHDYLFQMISLLIGCVIIAFGAYFEVVADVCMLPADGFTRALSKVTNKEFGTIRLIADSSQAAIALLLGLICLHTLAGVREGTVIGAILIGNIVKVISRVLCLEGIFKEDALLLKVSRN